MKQLIPILFLAIYGLVPPVTADAPQAGKVEMNSQPFRVIGYLLSSRPQESILKLQYEYLTDIIWFSVQPNEDGTLNEDLLFADKLRSLRKHAVKNDVQVHIGVGGWGRSKHFAEVAKDEEKRAVFVKALTKLCINHKLAGADIDWEYPKDERERAAATAMLRELRQSFGDHDLELSMAVAGRVSHFENEAYDLVDRVHIMSYDHHGPKRGPHSTFEHARGDVAFWKKTRDLPADKLLLGLPFYGRALGKDGSIEYGTWRDKFKSASDINEAGGFFVNNQVLIEKKVQYAQEQGLAGVMIWELNQDWIIDMPAEDRSLLRTIGRAVASEDASAGLNQQTR